MSSRQKRQRTAAGNDPPRLSLQRFQFDSTRDRPREALMGGQWCVPDSSHGWRIATGVNDCVQF